MQAASQNTNLCVSQSPLVEDICSLFVKLFDNIPLHVTDEHLVKRLRGKEKSGMALACRRGRELVQWNVKRVEFRDELDVSSDMNGNHFSEVAQLEAWQTVVGQRSAFIARLPQLKWLSIISYPHDAALVSELHQYGAASQGRITKLHLKAKELTCYSGAAIALACPALENLNMDYEFGNSNCLLASDFLRPLKDCPLESVRMLFHAG